MIEGVFEALCNIVATTITLVSAGMYYLSNMVKKLFRRGNNNRQASSSDEGSDEGADQAEQTASDESAGEAAQQETINLEGDSTGAAQQGTINLVDDSTSTDASVRHTDEGGSPEVPPRQVNQEDSTRAAVRQTVESGPTEPIVQQPNQDGPPEPTIRQGIEDSTEAGVRQTVESASTEPIVQQPSQDGPPEPTIRQGIEDDSTEPIVQQASQDGPPEPTIRQSSEDDSTGPIAEQKDQHRSPEPTIKQGTRDDFIEEAVKQTKEDGSGEVTIKQTDESGSTQPTVGQAIEKVSPETPVTQADESGSPESTTRKTYRDGLPEIAVRQATENGSPEATITQTNEDDANATMRSADEDGSPESAVKQTNGDGLPQVTTKQATDDASPDSTVTQADELASPEATTGEDISTDEPMEVTVLPVPEDGSQKAMPTEDGSYEPTTRPTDQSVPIEVTAREDDMSLSVRRSPSMLGILTSPAKSTEVDTPEAGPSRGRDQAESEIRTPIRSGSDDSSRRSRPAAAYSGGTLGRIEEVSTPEPSQTTMTEMMDVDGSIEPMDLDKTKSPPAQPTDEVVYQPREETYPLPVRTEPKLPAETSRRFHIIAPDYADEDLPSPLFGEDEEEEVTGIRRPLLRRSDAQDEEFIQNVLNSRTFDPSHSPLPSETSRDYHTASSMDQSSQQQQQQQQEQQLDEIQKALMTDDSSDRSTDSFYSGRSDLQESPAKVTPKAPESQPQPQASSVPDQSGQGTAQDGVSPTTDEARDQVGELPSFQAKTPRGAAKVPFEHPSTPDSVDPLDYDPSISDLRPFTPRTRPRSILKSTSKDRTPGRSRLRHRVSWQDDKKDQETQTDEEESPTDRPTRRGHSRRFRPGLTPSATSSRGPAGTLPAPSIRLPSTERPATSSSILAPIAGLASRIAGTGTPGRGVRSFRGSRLPGSPLPETDEEAMARRRREELNNYISLYQQRGYDLSRLKSLLDQPSPTVSQPAVSTSTPKLTVAQQRMHDKIKKLFERKKREEEARREAEREAEREASRIEARGAEVLPSPIRPPISTPVPSTSRWPAATSVKTPSRSVLEFLTPRRWLSGRETQQEKKDEQIDQEAIPGEDGYRGTPIRPQISSSVQPPPSPSTTRPPSPKQAPEPVPSTSAIPGDATRPSESVQAQVGVRISPPTPSETGDTMPGDQTREVSESEEPKSPSKRESIGARRRSEIFSPKKTQSAPGGPEGPGGSDDSGGSPSPRRSRLPRKSKRTSGRWRDSRSSRESTSSKESVSSRDSRRSRESISSRGSRRSRESISPRGSRGSRGSDIFEEVVEFVDEDIPEPVQESPSRSPASQRAERRSQTPDDSPDEISFSESLGALFRGRGRKRRGTSRRSRRGVRGRGRIFQPRNI